MMLDDLRQQASTGFEYEEIQSQEPPRPARFLGMTPAQTFIIAVMMLFITCVLSGAFLLVTRRVVPPFLY